MARFKGKDLYLKTDDQIYFGDNVDAALWFDGSDLRLDHTISGTWATQGHHLIRKDQIESYIDTVVSGVDEFTDLIDTPASYSGYGGDSPKYVKVKPDESGLEFGPALVGVTSSGITPPADSNLWFNTNPEWNTFFVYDPTRDKWLSVAKNNYLFTYAGAADGLYMSIGNISHSSAYFYMPRDATITAVIANSQESQNSAKGFEIRDGDTTVSGGYFQMSNWVYQSLTANIDVDAGARLKLYIDNIGLSVRNPIVMLEVALRYDVPTTSG